MAESPANGHKSKFAHHLFILLLVLLTVSLFACAKPSEQAKPAAGGEAAGQSTSKLQTKDQKKIIATFGRPKQFILAYLPVAGDDGQGLSRTETWYYPGHQKKITFAGGDILSVGAMTDPGEGVRYPNLHIENFDFSMGYKQVVEALGTTKVEPVEFANDIFAKDGVKSYLAHRAVFTIEQGHLTYMQTLGVKR